MVPKGSALRLAGGLATLGALLACLTVPAQPWHKYLNVFGTGTYAWGISLGSGTTPRSDVTQCTESQANSNWPTAWAANRLESRLATDFPDQFAGVAVSNCNATITIYETQATEDLSREAVAIAPPGSLRYSLVSNSLAQLLATHNLMLSKWDEVQAQGIVVAAFGTDVTLNREVIRVFKPTPAQTLVLGSLLGAGLITVETALHPAMVPASGEGA